MSEVFPSTIQDKIERTGVLAVLVVESVSTAVPLAQALLKGGIDAIELTLRTEAALDALKAIKTEVPAMTVGCGTVLTENQVDAVIEAGADFAVSPGLNPLTLRHAIKCVDFRSLLGSQQQVISNWPYQMVVVS